MRVTSRLTSPRWRGTIRGRLTRHPVLFWAIAAILALATAWLVSDLTAEARRTIDEWGRRQPVLVATERIEPGQPLAGATELVAVPERLAPSQALAAPADAVAASIIHAGEIIVAPRVEGTGGSGRAGRLPPGTAGVTIVVGPATPPLSLGDRVDLWATTDPFVAAGGSPSSAPVSRRATVVEVDETRVVLAVADADLARTAEALAAGVITLTIVP